MKLRNSLVLVCVALLLAACGSKYFILRDSYAPVKKVALVQWALNPHILLGTANDETGRVTDATNAWETFGKLMGNSYQVMPLAEMTANAAYTGAGGKAAWDGYFTAKGAMFFSADVETLEAGTIPADTAKKLCEGLGVDAVVGAYEGWGTQPGFGGFTSTSNNSYVMNMFDKNGVKIWGDVVWGQSEESFGTPGGIISADMPTWLKSNTQALTAALTEANKHLGK